MFRLTRAEGSPAPEIFAPRDNPRRAYHSAGFARNPLRNADFGLRNPQSEIRIPKFLPPCDDPRLA